MIAEIVERSDGVPLFVEELTKAVLESTEPGDQVAAVLSATPQSALLVPATLHASLMARLDRLGRLAKEIAQAGAVLGREFPYDLVLSVAGRPEVELRAALDRLAGAGLVFCRGVVPNASYMFKHALVQDAAYGTLLRGRRQDLHGRAADALIAAGQAATTEPEIIAHHLQNAMRTVEAIDFWRKAGDTAARRSANREAAEHFRRALALVEAQPGSPERRRIELAVLSQLASPLMGAYGWSAPEVGDVVERAADVARRLESSAEIAPAVANLWFFNTARGRHDRAAEISADVMRMARETGDPDVLLEAHHCAWASNFNLGRFREFVEHIDAGAAIYDEARHARHRHQVHGARSRRLPAEFQRARADAARASCPGASKHRGVRRTGTPFGASAVFGHRTVRLLPVQGSSRRCRRGRWERERVDQCDGRARPSDAARVRADVPRLGAVPVWRREGRARLAARRASGHGWDRGPDLSDDVRWAAG